MKLIFVYVLLVVLYAPACVCILKCDKCTFIIAGACCVAKPPNCCPHKPGECPSNDFGSADGPIPTIRFPMEVVTTCIGDQDCPGWRKCCPVLQSSTGTTYYTCQEPFTENSLGLRGLASGCPAQFGFNQFGQLGNQGGMINLG